MSKSSEPPLHDPTALSQYGRLAVVARAVVEGYMIGQHRSLFKGSSVEFVEHRQYYPGDEIRHIDWHAYGKTGKYYIKEYEEETNLRAYVLLDCSGSMAYAGKTLSKFAYGRIVASALSHLLVAQRDAVGFITFDGTTQLRFEPSTNPLQLEQVLSQLEAVEPKDETALHKAFDEILPSLKRRSLVIIISDFFDHLEPLRRSLDQFEHARHEVMLLQVLAPEECDFPFSRPTMFRSLERKGQRMLVDPHRLRSIYLKQFGEFLTELEGMSGNAGIDYTRFSTTDPCHLVLGAFLAARARRQGKRLKR